MKRHILREKHGNAWREYVRYSYWSKYRIEGARVTRSDDGRTGWTATIPGTDQGFADQIAPRVVDNRGWFTDDDAFATMRGGVTRCGRVLVPYVVHSDSDGVLLMLGDTFPANEEGALREAAIRAHDCARIRAEQEREYNAAEQERYRRQENRDRVRELIRAIRASVLDPTICDIMRDQIRELRTTNH